MKKFLLLIIILSIVSCKDKAINKTDFLNMKANKRNSGDIRGIWLMDNPKDLKLIKDFLEFHNDKFTTGYCIEVSEKKDKAKIYFTISNQVFEVKIKRMSETKFLIENGKHSRVFSIIRTSTSSDKNKYFLEWYYDDLNPYDINKGEGQPLDGTNFYDICTDRPEYECSVDGCLQYIKGSDEILEAEELRTDAGEPMD